MMRVIGSMFRMICRYAQARMQAYVNRELNAGERRFISRHLDACDACYASYRQQIIIRDELKRTVPKLAQPSDAALGRMWAGIQSELGQPTPPSKPAASVTPFMRYSLASIAAMLMMLVSVNVAGHTAYDMVDNVPSPATFHTPPPATDVLTPPPQPTIVAQVPLSLTSTSTVITLQNTPVPGTPGR